MPYMWALDYMPPGSVAVMPGGRVVYLQDVSPELKERFEADIKRLYAETEERHKQSIYSPDDVI